MRPTKYNVTRNLPWIYFISYQDRKKIPLCFEDEHRPFREVASSGSLPPNSALPWTKVTMESCNCIIASQCLFVYRTVHSKFKNELMILISFLSTKTVLIDIILWQKYLVIAACQDAMFIDGLFQGNDRLIFSWWYWYFCFPTISHLSKSLAY